MKAFRVDGQAPFGRLRQKFSLDVVASSKADAEHRVYSIIGSRHKATRRSINIESVSEIDPRTSQEPSVLHHFREEIAAAGGTIALFEKKSERQRRIHEGRIPGNVEAVLWNNLNFSEQRDSLK